MTWPKLTASDLESLSRIYLNEATAKFYTQAELYRWFSVGVSDIASKAGAVQRILNAQTGASVRTVDFNALKVQFVEYVPSSGRSIMLTKIDPLKIGNYPITGTAPQYWYEYGTQIGIEPLPNAVYQLRLYVSDIAKMIVFDNAGYASGWTAGAGWTAGDNAIHTGASSDLTYGTALTEGANYTIELRITGVGTGGTVTPYLGSMTGVPITGNGYYMQTITALGGTPALKFTAANDIIIEDLYVYQEVDYAAAADQIELESAWNPLVALYGAMKGLSKNKEVNAAMLLNTIYTNEMAYIRQNMVDVKPDGRLDLVYK
jgi:hypothetical protein